MVKLPGNILSFHQLQLSMEHEVRVTINAPPYSGACFCHELGINWEAHTAEAHHERSSKPGSHGYKPSTRHWDSPLTLYGIEPWLTWSFIHTSIHRISGRSLGSICSCAHCFRSVSGVASTHSHCFLVSGICNGVPSGSHLIGYWIGACDGNFGVNGQGEGYTGWMSSFIIIVEEILFESADTCSLDSPRLGLHCAP